jgi:MFS family permease
MLKRRGTDERYPSQQAVRWLAWLARQMSQRAQAEFFIEGLQPSWLPSRSQRRLYNVGVRLIGAAAFVLAYAVGSALACALAGETADIVLVGLAFGLAAGLAFALPGLVPLGLPDWAVVALSAGLTALLVGAFLGPGGGLIAGLIFGLPAGLAGLGIVDRDRIQIAERVTWSWKKAILGGIVGLGAGLTGGLVFERVVGQPVDLADELAIGLPAGLAFMLALGLSRSEAVERRTRPNQGIRRSARNAMWVGGTALLASVLCSVPIGILEGALFNGLAFGLFVGLPTGLTAGLAVGGCACIQHGLLRLILCRGGCLPCDLVHFLDCATDCVFLRRVGGGYIFVHRLLLEHFAALES